MSDVRLVAFDMDGTLLGESLLLRPRVVDAVARMEARGVRGCIITGRMYRSVLPYVRQLHLDAPVVCYQGAATIDPLTDEVLFDLPVPNAVAIEVVRYARAHDAHVQLYANDRFYCESLNAYSRLYAHLSGVEPILVPSLEIAFDGRDSTKVVIVAEPDVALAHTEALRVMLGDRGYVTRSISSFVEIMNPRVDKGRALAFVARHLGIPIGNVLAIGDSWNDAPLLAAAGIGVAMGSAPNELKAVADAVVADVENDGVAEALDRYVLA